MIENLVHRIPFSRFPKAIPTGRSIEATFKRQPLRWYISDCENDEATVHASYWGELNARKSPCHAANSDKQAAISIIPTGVGCSIGGYAGDAAPVTRLLASAVDYLVCNVNSVNASNFISLERNTLYTDGFAIDEFCRGLSHLHIPIKNRVGVILEQSPDHVIDHAFNIVNAVRAVHGVEVAGVTITDAAIGGRCERNESGAFSGTVENLPTLFKACESLIAQGATALAVSSHIQNLPRDAYTNHFEGADANPIGGAEAMISYVLRKKYGLPVAHSPLTNIKDLDVHDNIVDVRAAGEMASKSGLACVLVGLAAAPHSCGVLRASQTLGLENVLAMICPSTCLGGIPALYLCDAGIPIIAVKQNSTLMKATKAQLKLSNVFEVESYAEAAGVLMCLKRGISLESVYRPMPTFRPTRSA